MKLLGVDQAAELINNGAIVAYPTEAVFGLGCDPQNETAIRNLYRLKNRPHRYGVILIAASFEQLAPYCQTLSEKCWRTVARSWPGAHTWLFPMSDSCPRWLTGAYDSIAVRVTAHPVAAALCRAATRALVSTSANRHGEPPATTAEEVAQIFTSRLGGIVGGAVAGADGPTPITDAVSGERIRI